MYSKFFKLMAFTLALVFLTACGQKVETTAYETQSLEAVASGIEIETVEGTPAEKVEIYSEKAQEAQMKLRFLLETGSLRASEETPKIGFFSNIIPAAYAEEDDSSVEDQVEELLAEIQTYTELAAEAATESTDPEEIADLLDEVQETQASTLEILEEVSDEVEEIVGSIIEDVTEEVEASMEEIDEVAAEVNEAIESGAETIEVDVETDVEEFLAEGIKKINLREKINPKKRAERKVQLAIREVEKVRQRLIENEVPQEEADAILAELQERAGEAQQLVENGEFKEATKIAQENKRETNKLKSVVARAKDARHRFEGLRELADEGDLVAVEQLEKLKPLAEEGKKFKEILEERKDIYQEFKEKAKEERQDFKEVRQGANEDLFELKKMQVAGDITEEEFLLEKEVICAQVKEIREEKHELEKNLREERIDYLKEFSGLPKEEIQAKKEEIDKEFEERRQRINDDQKKLYSVIQSGDKKAIQSMKTDIQEKNEQAREKQKDNVQVFLKNTIEALPLEEQETIRQKRKDLNVARDELQEVKKEIQGGTQERREEFREDKQELHNAAPSDQREILKAVKEASKDNRDSLKEDRKELTQGFQESKEEPKGTGKDFRDAVKNVEVKAPNKPSLKNNNQSPKNIPSRPAGMR